MHETTAPTDARDRLHAQAIRNRLHDQGFEFHSDAQALALAPHLRWTTGVCGAAVLLGAVFQYAPLLWAMAPLALMGAVRGLHPFDWAYNRWFRGEGPLIPRYGAARRFTFGLATAWLIGAGIAFSMGATTLGTIMALVQVANALSATTTHLLPPATLFSLARRGVSGFGARPRMWHTPGRWPFGPGQRWGLGRWRSG